MSDQNKQAQQVFQAVCKALDKQGWKYNKDSGNLQAQLTLRGDSVPLTFGLMVDEERMLLQIVCSLPCKLSGDRLTEGSVAACVASSCLPNGGFVCDMQDGTIVFRVTACYRESAVSSDLIHHLLTYSCAVADRYGPKFLDLSQGKLSIQAFMEQVQ